MKNARHSENELYIDKYKKTILKHSHKLNIPELDVIYKKEKINKTCFKIKTFELKKKENFDFKLSDTKISESDKNNFRKCVKVKLLLTNTQKNIIQRWFYANTLMYNETLRHIKNNKLNINARDLRTNYLKNIRDKIIEESRLSYIKKETRIVTHILDCSIKMACSNYKTAFSNHKRGYIKHFRIRYWKYNRPNQILEIENNYFKRGTLCPKIFGEIKAIKDKKKFDLADIEKIYKTGCKLFYNRINNEYFLLIPEKVSFLKNNCKKEIIALDPGIRTFMTGISECETVKIADKFNNKIKNLLERTDKINNKKEIPVEIKKKNLLKNNRKISNLVDELHWKTINYLTKNYKNVLVGDMSIKGITKKNQSKLQKMTKRIGYKMKFYLFKQRLEYKCKIKGINFKEVDEKYTSKICSNCGWLNEKLGSCKVFSCNECKEKLDRDINGARGIMLKIRF